MLLGVNAVIEYNRQVINFSEILADVTDIMLKLNGVIILFIISGLK